LMRIAKYRPAGPPPIMSTFMRCSSLPAAGPTGFYRCIAALYWRGV
jgi:hypothetical protein